MRTSAPAAARMPGAAAPGRNAQPAGKLSVTVSAAAVPPAPGGPTPFLLARTGGPRRTWLIVIVAALVVVALTFGSIFLVTVSPSPPRGAVASATYLLNATTGSVSFPDCAVVTVTWQDLTHHQVGFGVWSGEAIYASDCRGPPDSDNHSCPVGACQPGQISMGLGPWEYENATHGWFQFTATQPGYSFIEMNPNTSGPSHDPIQFTVGYSTAVIPTTWAVPAFLGLITTGGAALACGVVMAVQLLRRKREAPT